MDNKFAQQLKKGVLDMVVLRLVQEKSTYGYEILQNLEQRGEGFFDLKEGTLYPLLHMLEQQGDIESFEQPAPTGRVRRYYRITPKGKKTLTGKKAEWSAYEKAVNLVLGGVVHA